jgi:hypothetical protein
LFGLVLKQRILGPLATFGKKDLGKTFGKTDLGKTFGKNGPWQIFGKNGSTCCK